MPVALGTGHASLYFIPGLDPSSHFPWLPVPSIPPGPGEREGLRGRFIRTDAFLEAGRTRKSGRLGHHGL